MTKTASILTRTHSGGVLEIELIAFGEGAENVIHVGLGT